MAATWIEPPPEPRGMGCVGKGCLTLLGFILFIVFAFVIGGYIGVRYVLTSDAPRTLPQVAVADSTAEPQVEVHTATATPESTPVPVAEVKQRSDAFETASRSGQKAAVQYSAAEINALIAANRKAQGKAFVAIENNVMRVQVSIPLEKMGFRGRYLNGDFSIAAAEDGNPRSVRVTQSSLGGVEMPGRVLNFLLGAGSVQGYVEQYAGEFDVSSFRIIDNKVVLETGGPR